ncbi:MAG: penicillin-binding transpeptidase domain-containing protein [Polyangiaceae bacterium]
MSRRTTKLWRALVTAGLLGLGAACGSADTPERSAPLASPTATATPSASPRVERDEVGVRVDLDPDLQRVLEDQLLEAAKGRDVEASGGVVIDVETNTVKALVGPDFLGAPTPPGALLLPLIAGAALDHALVRADEAIDCGNGSRTFPSGQRLADHSAFGSLAPRDIVAVSSNVGGSRLFDRLGEAATRTLLTALGFERAIATEGVHAPPASMPGASAENTLAGASFALGYTLSVAPIHVALAYAEIARIADVGGGPPAPRPPRSSAPPFTPQGARAVLDLLEAATTGAGTGANAAVPGVRVGGKTATVQGAAGAKGSASFVGVAPVDAPRFVVYVALRGDGLVGKNVTAPAFGRVISLLGKGLPAPKTAGANSNHSLKTFPPAPADTSGETRVFPYAAFGPQALAGELLGPECYAFAECCCAEIGDSFDVRVLLFQGITEAKARDRYVTAPSVGDYRYVPACRARRYLVDALKEERASAPEDRIPALERTLADTLQAVDAAFPSAASEPCAP